MIDFTMFLRMKGCKIEKLLMEVRCVYEQVSGWLEMMGISKTKE